MRKKKVMSLILAGVMAAGLCACGSSSAESSTGSSTAESAAASAETTVETADGTAETAEEAKTVEKPESISWWTHDGLGETDYVEEWNAKYEELTGVKLERTVVSNNEYYELLEIAFASGTEPNVFDLTAEGKLTYYATQGGVADLTDLVKESGLYDKIDEAVWDALSIDGRIYGIPRYYPSISVSHVRQDWLDELGMDVPTTYDEFIEMLRAFRDEIDECTVPLTAAGLTSAQYLPEFYWDATPDFAKVDGMWVDGMLEDNMADALTRLRDAYAEGLIDTEVVTNTTSACRDKWYSGEVGVFNYWADKWTDTLTSRLQENFPDASVTPISAIEDTYYRYSAYSVWCIDGKLSEEEVEQVFTYFLNVLCDGGEGELLNLCGVEGVHYEIGEDGKLSFLPRPETEDTFQAVFGVTYNPIASLEEMPFEWPDSTEVSAKSREVAAESGVNLPASPASDTLNRITADLSSIRQETIANIVMGTVSVEDGLASYRSQVEALGIEQVLV